MKNKPLQNIIILSIVLWLAIIIMVVAFVSVANAATWIKQEGIYTLYKVPPTNSNRYELSSKTVPSTWLKQEGAYTQLKSAAGATKYELNATVSDCSGFICKDDFGLTFDLTKNTVLTCPMVKISNAQIQVYEGLQFNAVSCR